VKHTNEKSFNQPVGCCTERVFIIFRDADVSKFEWVRNLFAANSVSRLMTYEQVQFMDISCDSSMFNANKLPQFWLLVTNDSKFIRQSTKCFTSIYDNILVKNYIFCCYGHGKKISSWLLIDKEQITISSMTPWFGKLCTEKKIHLSH